MKALQAFIFNYSCNGTHVGVNKEKEKERERERNYEECPAFFYSLTVICASIARGCPGNDINIGWFKKADTGMN